MCVSVCVYNLMYTCISQKIKSTDLGIGARKRSDGERNDVCQTYIHSVLEPLINYTHH